MTARQSEIVTKALRMVDGGMTPYAAAKKTGIAFSTIYRALERRAREFQAEGEAIKRERRALDERKAALEAKTKRRGGPHDAQHVQQALVLGTRSWHGFEVNEVVTRDRVIYACEGRLAKGVIIREERKKAMVARMRSAPDSMVWSPQQPKGWGASPFNLNNWRTVDGRPISIA